MKLDRQKILEDILGGTGALILLLVAIFQYDTLLSTDVAGIGSSAKAGKALMIFLNSIGGKLLVFGVLSIVMIYAYGCALIRYQKQNKKRKSIDFDKILKKGTKIIFDNHELEIVQFQKAGKRYNGFGKMYFDKKKNNWKGVQFNKLILSYDGKSKLRGNYKILDPTEWENCGGNINEILKNPNYIDSIKHLTEIANTTGKCPICKFNIEIVDKRCKNCKTYIRL